MNYEHVLWHKNNQGNWVIAESEDTPRLFCDDYMICLAGDLDLGTHSRYADKMVPGMKQRWINAPTVPPISRDQLAGVWPEPIVRRFVITPDNFLFLNERYVRCFDDDAVFHGSAPNKQVMVYEQGNLAGIVMPVRALKDVELWGRRVPDRIIFHECEGGDE